MKTVTFTTRSRRALRRLSAEARGRVQVALDRYAETGEGDVVALVGHDAVRQRVGDYRIVFVETADAIDVRLIGHRRDIYRDLDNL